MSLSRKSPPPSRRMTSWIRRWKGLGAVVWGDFVLDEYWRCRSSRVSREAPVLVLDYQSRVIQGGGAANAALNLAALGARVAVVGWVGRDDAGHELRALLAGAGINTEGLLAHSRQATVVKTRIVAGSVHTAQQQVVRVDRGSAFADGARERSALLLALDEAARGAEAIVLSDYGYDSVTPALARTRMRPWRAAGVVVGLDARYRLASYRDVTVATPNEEEAERAAGQTIASDRDLERAALRIRRRLRASHLVVTRGRDGLTLWSDPGGVSLEAWGGNEAVDVTGAGDAVIATMTLALAAGAPALTAAALANAAGSVAVSRRGAVAVGVRPLLASLGAGSR